MIPSTFATRKEVKNLEWGFEIVINLKAWKTQSTTRKIKNADSLFQHPQAPWSCFRRSRTSRKAPQAPWWSWSCRWSAPPPNQLR
ncbi:hypothetical protein LENED_005275 [Lentinula edodes]|uniref:Uncharacterized protein n=1 Tax=Lentinula edodes TaxID=5353 RepID=A0A1Q3E8H3_LENED|nr:hypothetical protein LENED_005275 [Lentinula edodes]